jgi:hypothetical protein
VTTQLLYFRKRNINRELEREKGDNVLVSEVCASILWVSLCVCALPRSPGMCAFEGGGRIMK